MTDSSKWIDWYLTQKETRLRKETAELLRPHLDVLALPKKHVLVRENQTSGIVYLIAKGAARSFYLHNGTEVHTWFAFEGEAVGSLRNFNNMPSRETIALLEDSTLISFDINGIKPLMNVHVDISNWVHTTILEHALYLEDRLFYTHLQSAGSRFDNLLAHEPEIMRRVPLTYIASYLGVSRETLSRLRAR